MNAACPECGYHWGANGAPDNDEFPVPYEENDKLFTLQFCSVACRDAYKDAE